MAPDEIDVARYMLCAALDEAIGWHASWGQHQRLGPNWSRQSPCTQQGLGRQEVFQLLRPHRPAPAHHYRAAGTLMRKPRLKPLPGRRPPMTSEALPPQR